MNTRGINANGTDTVVVERFNNVWVRKLVHEHLSFIHPFGGEGYVILSTLSGMPEIG